MSIRWLTVFLDFPADAFGSGVAFWQAVTGSGLSAYRGTTDEFATLLPPDGDAYLRVQRLAAGDGGCHLDLHVDTAIEPLAAAAERAAVTRRPAAAHRRRPDHRGQPGGIHVLPSGVARRARRAIPAVIGRAGASRVDTLCIDVPPTEFERECAFWAALTGWQATPAPVPGFAFLRSRPHCRSGSSCSAWGAQPLGSGLGRTSTSAPLIPPRSARTWRLGPG